jgi:hypothetical protein
MQRPGKLIFRAGNLYAEFYMIASSLKKRRANCKDSAPFLIRTL